MARMFIQASGWGSSFDEHWADGFDAFVTHAQLTEIGSGGSGCRTEESGVYVFGAIWIR